MVQYGDTVLLSTVNRSKEPRKENDFFPLTVELFFHQTYFPPNYFVD